MANWSIPNSNGPSPSNDGYGKRGWRFIRHPLTIFLAGGFCTLAVLALLTWYWASSHWPIVDYAYRNLPLVKLEVICKRTFSIDSVGGVWTDEYTKEIIDDLVASGDYYLKIDNVVYVPYEYVDIYKPEWSEDYELYHENPRSFFYPYMANLIILKKTIERRLVDGRISIADLQAYEWNPWRTGIPINTVKDFMTVAGNNDCQLMRDVFFKGGRFAGE